MSESERLNLRCSPAEKAFLLAIAQQEGKDITSVLLDAAAAKYPGFPREPRKEGRPQKVQQQSLMDELKALEISIQIAESNVREWMADGMDAKAEQAYWQKLTRRKDELLRELGLPDDYNYKSHLD